MHLTNAELRELIDGEVAPGRLPAVREHLASCAQCRARSALLTESAVIADGLLGLTDPPPVILDADALMQRAVLLRLRRVPGLVAATMTLLLVGTAAAIVARPLLRALGVASPGTRQSSTPAAVTVPAPALESAQAAIAIVPGREAIIALANVQSTGVLHITLGSDSELVFRASAPVPVRVHAAGIAVANANMSASYDLILPGRGGHIQVRVAGRILFDKDADGHVRAAVSADGAGRYTIPVR